MAEDLDLRALADSGEPGRGRRDAAREHVVGRELAVGTFLDAAARYGSEEYVICPLGVRSRDEFERLGQALPLRVISPMALVEKRLPPMSVVHELGRHRLHRLARLRRMAPAGWGPITAQAHGLGYAQLMDDVALSTLARLDPGDAIFAPGTDATKVLEQAFDRVTGALPTGPGCLRRPDIVHVPLGVDLDDLSPVRRTDARARLALPETDFVFLMLGRLSPVDKADIRPVFRAFRRLLEQIGGERSVRLVVAGSDRDEGGGYTGILRVLAGELGIGHAVSFLRNPIVGERRDLYSSADVFLANSDTTRESFGLTVAEALVMSLPVIAVDWSGYRDLVCDGVNGFTVPSMMPDDMTWTDRIDLLCTEQGASFAGAQCVSFDERRLTDRMMLLARASDDVMARFRAASRSTRSWLGLPAMVERYERAWGELRRRRADEVVTQPAFSDPSMRQLFGSWATQRLMSTDLLSLRERDSSKLAACLSSYRHLWMAGFDVDLIRLIVANLADDALTSAELVERVDHPVDAAKLSWHVGWLLKHGLISVVRERS